MQSFVNLLADWIFAVKIQMQYGAGFGAMHCANTMHSPLGIEEYKVEGVGRRGRKYF